MQAIAELEKQWRERARFRRLNTGPTIEGDGVVLGSDTVLAKRHSDGALNSNDARTLTLLAVAYGRPVERSVLQKLELASRHAQSGNKAMASMHIALAGLPLLSPDDARRLFIADGLIERGVALRDIWAALEFDPAPLDALEKYDPDEARVPAGSGRPSGRWARDGAEALEGPQPSPPPITPSPPAPTAAARALELAGAAARAVARIAARYAPKLLDIAADAAPPFVFLDSLLGADSTGGTHFQGDVVGRPDLHYSWYQDELAPRITRKSDGRDVEWFLRPDSRTFVDRNGLVVARIVGRTIIADAGALSDPSLQPPRIDPRDEPDRCPKPTDDKDGRVGPVGEKDKDYEDHVKRLVNPDDPTPRGLGYMFPNPMRPLYPVIYDDCRHRTGDLIEAKGTGYAAMLAKPDGFMREILAYKWRRQATNQIDAGRNRTLEWYFAEREAADYARKVFAEYPQFSRIRIFYEYWRPGMP